MFENAIQEILPQLAKILAFFAVFISGYKVVDFKGGIPFINNKIISKRDSLIAIIIGGGILLLIIEPILESIILDILYNNVKYALSAAFLLGGFALLKLNEQVRWNYKTYGYGSICTGIFLVFYVS